MHLQSNVIWGWRVLDMRKRRQRTGRGALCTEGWLAGAVGAVVWCLHSYLIVAIVVGRGGRLGQVVYRDGGGSIVGHIHRVAAALLRRHRLMGVRMLLRIVGVVIVMMMVMVVVLVMMITPRRTCTTSGVCGVGSTRRGRGLLANDGRDRRGHGTSRPTRGRGRRTTEHVGDCTHAQYKKYRQ